MHTFVCLYRDRYVEIDRADGDDVQLAGWIISGMVKRKNSYQLLEKNEKKTVLRAM